MVHFNPDMVRIHYFKDLSIRSTQHTNWQDSLWVMASGSLAKIGQLVNFTGEYGITYKHWASGAPVNFTGKYRIRCKH